MSWNYRLTKSTFKDSNYEEELFEVREVHYNRAGGIWAVSEKTAGVCGLTIEETVETLFKIEQAFDKDIIDLDNFIFATADLD